MKPQTPSPAFPLKEKIKSLPGVLGIRLEEEPRYEVLRKEGAFEIRRYQAFDVAQTEVEGSHSDAVNEGFNRLALYLFGENHPREKMEMTTPVLQESVDRTTLTQAEPSQTSRGWMISFVLPLGRSLATAPQPLSPKIQLRHVPAHTVAVSRYPGNNDESRMQEALEELRLWTTKCGCEIKERIQFAQYDAPFTVPFLKRNEVHLEISDGQPSQTQPL